MNSYQALSVIGSRNWQPIQQSLLLSDQRCLTQRQPPHPFTLVYQTQDCTDGHFSQCRAPGARIMGPADMISLPTAYHADWYKIRLNPFGGSHSKLRVKVKHYFSGSKPSPYLAKMFKFLILIALVPAVMLQNADNVPHEGWDVVAVRPCAGVRPLPAQVRIENCPAMPCDLRRGTNVLMAMDYTSVQDATSLHTVATATALGITAPYELPADVAAACNWLVQARCPTSAGEDLTYHLQMPITAIYPLVSVTIEIDLQDQTGQSHGCFVVDTRVVAN